MPDEPTDYTGNSKREKEAKAKGQKGEKDVAKKIETIVTTPVIVQKRGIFRRMKDTLVEVDFKSTVAYVIADVLIPAAKETVFDALVKGGSYSIFGDRSVRGRGRTYHSSDESHVTYSRGIDRGSRSMGLGRHAPEPQRGSRSHRYGIDNFIIVDKQEAELIVESMLNAIEEFEYVSVADLNEMIGIKPHPIDYKWGWTRVDGVEIHQVSQGYLIDLPEPEAL